MDSIKTEHSLDELVHEMEQKEQMDSLKYLVQKLPDITNRLKSLDEKLSFIESVVNDKESLSQVGRELEEKADNLDLTKEHLQAMLDMVHLMPQMVPMMERMNNIAAFIQDIATDQDSLSYALKGVNDVVPVEKTMDVIKETNIRFEEKEHMPDLSLMKMYQLLKDPTVQKGFKYMKTMLEVVNDK